MDKLTVIKIKYDDGTYSDEIPVSVPSENVEWDSTHTLVDILGSIDVDVTGTIQDQINQLFNEKVNSFEVAALKSRIDNFTKLESGSTTGDAELADIRVGADGTVYDNAGDAVRQQVGELKSAMTLIQSENLFDESKQTKGYQYYSDGTIHENSDLAISDFIEVDKNRELFFGKRYPDDSVRKATVTNVIEFDENKNYVKGTARVTNIIPDDRTKYIRFSRNLNDQPYGIMLTYDNYATTFVEYEHYYACIDKEAKKNSTNWYNANYFGVLESNSAEDNFVALMALLTDVSDSGGGVIYIPRGKYNLKNSDNEIYNFNNIEIIGDGLATVLIR